MPMKWFASSAFSYIQILFKELLYTFIRDFIADTVLGQVFGWIYGKIVEAAG